MTLHERGASWFSAQVKLNCAKFAEMNKSARGSRIARLCPHGDHVRTNLGCGW